MEFLALHHHSILRNTLLILCLGLWACSSSDPDPPDKEEPCQNDETGRISVQELQSFYKGEVAAIPREGFLEGVVISSDQEGNIFGSLYIQDKAADPEFGLEIRTDLLDAYTRFPPGSRIRISLKGLYLGRSEGGWALGAVREIFGNPALDRLPALETLERISLDCGADPVELIPRTLSPEELDVRFIHTLVRLEGVEVSDAYESQNFAEPESETLVPLRSCNGEEIALRNSGYSDFHMSRLPEGSGSATGILLGSEASPKLLLRSESDLVFDAPRCDELFPPERSDQVLISELADPDNEPSARFLELYNAGNQSVDLKGWRLVRYTNANDEPGGVAELDGLRMPPGSTLVFAVNPEVFEAVYGQPPDVQLRSNGPADSNGDDNIVLLNPFDEISDIYGIPGEDGSGTAHEFEDGRALRKSGVLRASPEFRPEQWIIFNDTGKEGTIKQPLNAPVDFSPGVHPDPDGSS